MFSISAINDSDSKGQWEPLAPTKEAQEFHLSQTYHDGLLKLQAKDYENARELLESVLKDPMISSSQVDDTATDGHLLELRFLALKNLATVFIQQGPTHYENALHCYLQAVEIDAKDSVLWNQLGTLSCSMGLLSISRWAFEQGLVCSPNNWNCMEKLLEVLIAIGDEVSCLSVAELILRNWPSHCRALHVKRTIENCELIPFAPRGIDKLEPTHVRLKFLGKRKATSDNNIEEGIPIKKPNQNIDLHLAEVSWRALIDAVLGALISSGGSTSDLSTEKPCKSGDIKLVLHLPSGSVKLTGSIDDNLSLGECNSENASIVKEKEVASAFEEQTQERRSTRLESLRNRKPGKEELEFASSKDPAKSIVECLLPFIVDGPGTKNSDSAPSFSNCHDDQVNSSGIEAIDVAKFVVRTSKNYGAYHFGHLLLEEVASRGFLHQHYFVKFLELEKLTRHWGQERTPECSLFLAELYYDFGFRSSDVPVLSDFMSEVSYHLCKIIEFVALDCPFLSGAISGAENCFSLSSVQSVTEIAAGNFSCHDTLIDNPFFTNKYCFWVRFFWLSGRLSSFAGNNAKAHQEFCISLGFLAKIGEKNDPPCSVQRPYCKAIQELTTDRVLHDINLLEVDFVLKEGTVAEMMEKHMYSECINLLAPLLLSTTDVPLDCLPIAGKEGELTSTELSALDILIQACEKAKPLDAEVYLNCHSRRLQVLMIAAGMEEFVSLCKPFHKISGSNTSILSDSESKGSVSKDLNNQVVEEVKAISCCASRIKNIYPSPDLNCCPFSPKSIGNVQLLLVAVMYNIASIFISKKSSGLAIVGQAERRCFVDAVIAFCKLQHLNPNIPVKTRIDLIVAVHDLLAGYGLCCAGEDGEGEEESFLKLAIKCLLALDMKLKSYLHSSNRGLSTTQCEEQSNSAHLKTSLKESNLNNRNIEVGQDESVTVVKNMALEGVAAKGISSHDSLEKEVPLIAIDEDEPEGKCHVDIASNHFVKCSGELSEDEREDLELEIDNALDQCFFCLYGLNLRSDSSYEDDLAVHRNTSRGDYQSKEQCADVFQYILSYAKASSKTGLAKLRRVLRAIRKHFSKPPDEILEGNAIDKFLDDPDLCEDRLSEAVGSDRFLDFMMKLILPDSENPNQCRVSLLGSSEPYYEVYCNLYYLLAQSEEMSATDKWPGFVLTKEGEEFVDQKANLFKYDLLYNPMRLESWERLANIYDEEVDLLLNDGSKHINVVEWKKNATLQKRVEMSRRRSRRCLLMSLALAKTPPQQCEIYELLALVYYDSLQNVVPFYDQRTVQSSKDEAWMVFCKNSMKHFKEAFFLKQDWSHAFYLGKLSEKLGCPNDLWFSYYDKAISLNPSAVDPVYRMHASRLKLLWRCGKENFDALKVVTAHCFSRSTKDTVMNILKGVGTQSQQGPVHSGDIMNLVDRKEQMATEVHLLEEAWHLLYTDSLCAIQSCVEGDLKHFHKARYTLAQGFYRRGESGDLERAKDELSFCFKSSRSSFTINMWEIDGMVKKGRRKTPGPCGNKKALEVNLPESSRKFITCIRKYVLFYLKLLEECGDVCTLDRAYTSLRTDKRFSLCLEDLVPVALGRYIQALISSMRQAETDGSGAVDHLQEKLFTLFMEQGNLWPDICNLPDVMGPGLSESCLYGYLYQYIQSLEENVRLDTLEGIIEKMRKRFKNPKLSNSNCAKVCKHSSMVWCRTIVISLALITPLHSGFSSEGQVFSPSDVSLEMDHLLCVDIQTNDLGNSVSDDSCHLKYLETKWASMLSKLKNVVVRKASEENLETANTLLRCCYNFYRESSCVSLPFGINLYVMPSQLAAEVQFLPGMDGVEILDLSVPRKLLLWAYTLFHGRFSNISAVIKHCEENLKLKTRKGSGMSSASSNAPTSIINAHAAHTGSGKDGVAHGGGSSEVDAAPLPVTPSSVSPHGESATAVPPCETQNSFTAPRLQHCNSTAGKSETQKGCPTAVPPCETQESYTTGNTIALPSGETPNNVTAPHTRHCNSTTGKSETRKGFTSGNTTVPPCKTQQSFTSSNAIVPSSETHNSFTRLQLQHCNSSDGRHETQEGFTGGHTTVVPPCETQKNFTSGNGTALPSGETQNSSTAELLQHCNSDTGRRDVILKHGEDADEKTASNV